MLIDAAIEEAKRAKRLTPVGVLAPWAPQPRALLMCEPIRASVENGKLDADPKERLRWAQLEAVMNLFTEGRFVTETLFKQLTDFRFEHWEIKSRRPSPSIRVFGRFARPDVFIATHAKNRACLGGMWSEAFEREKLVCEEYWVKAGLPCTPPPGAFSDPPKFRYEAYITENATRKVEVPT